MLALIDLVSRWTSPTRPSMSSTVSLAQSGGVGSARQGLPRECAHVSAPHRSVKMMLCIDVDLRLRACSPKSLGGSTCGLPVEEYDGVVCAVTADAVVVVVVAVAGVAVDVAAVIVDEDVTGILKAIEGREARERRQVTTWNLTWMVLDMVLLRGKQER